MNYESLVTQSRSISWRSITSAERTAREAQPELSTHRITGIFHCKPNVMKLNMQLFMPHAKWQRL